MSVVARSASRRGRAYMTRRDDFSLVRARARVVARRASSCADRSFPSREVPSLSELETSPSR